MLIVTGCQGLKLTYEYTWATVVVHLELICLIVPFQDLCVNRESRDNGLLLILPDLQD